MKKCSGTSEANHQPDPLFADQPAVLRIEVQATAISRLAAWGLASP